ncbi:hypothetical protein FACS1894195_2140 [Bacteroidia bacterium]|nr:hypothetical protein FACS1894195_2140 [Bacteroidia bacterium]
MSIGIIFTLAITLDTNKENRTWNKYITTYQYLSNFSELLGNTDKMLKDTLNLDGSNKNVILWNDSTLKILFSTHPNYRYQILKIVEYLNQLSLGCKNGIYDEKLVWQKKRTEITHITSALQPYFELRRKELGHGICAELQYMGKAWKKNNGKYRKWDEEDQENFRKHKEELEEQEKDLINNQR